MLFKNIIFNDPAGARDSQTFYFYLGITLPRKGIF